MDRFDLVAFDNYIQLRTDLRSAVTAARTQGAAVTSGQGPEGVTLGGQCIGGGKRKQLGDSKESDGCSQGRHHQPKECAPSDADPQPPGSSAPPPPGARHRSSPPPAALPSGWADKDGDTREGQKCGSSAWRSATPLPETSPMGGESIAPLEDRSRGQWVSRSLDKFACQKDHAAAPAPPPNNERLALQLDELAVVYESRGDEWRKMSYSKGAKILRGLKWEVTEASQLRSVRGFGDSLIAKVAEILETGRSARLDRMMASEHAQAMTGCARCTTCVLRRACCDARRTF
mgnify:CR=1 FL=1